MDILKHPTLANLLVRLNLLSSFAVKGTGRQKSKNKSELSLSDSELDAFEQRLDEILIDPGLVVEERVYLISLEKVRDKLGKDWSRSEKIIHDTVNSILKARLSSIDIHIKFDELSYLVVFTSLQPEEAQLKCAAIVGEILEKIVNREPFADLMDINKLTVGRNDDVRIESLPKIEDLLEDAIIRFKNAQVSGGIKAQNPAFAKTGSAEKLGGDVQATFRPMLTMRSKTISTYMCLPIRPAISGFKSGYEVLDDPSDVLQILALDLWVLETGGRAVNSILTEKKNALVAIPVHFETLANHLRQAEYIKSSKATLNAFKKNIIFEIVELPDSVPQGRLIELVSILRPHGRAIMAQFSLDHSNFSGYASSGLHAVGFNLYSRHEREPAIMKKMDVFIESAKKNNLKTYILGLRSLSLYTAAVTEGFDYISGHVLTSVSKKAENFSEFRLDTPYQEMLETDRSAPKD